MPKKESLRKKYYTLRKKKYFEIQTGFFNPLLKLINKIKKKKYINLSSYYPSSFEVNTLKIFETNMKKKIRISLPALRGKNAMNFYQWNYHEVLKVNKFGMLEPFVQSSYIVPDVILVPLLSYDRNKNRLGYGKGFYDRYLKKYKNILKIGVAFSFQKYNKLPASNLDVKLNYILTEKGLQKK